MNDAYPLEKHYASSDKYYYIVLFCLKIFFTFTNSVDPNEMQHYAAFLWVFTVCKSTRNAMG